MFWLNLNHFGRKCRHIHTLGLKLLVATAVPTPQFWTSQAFVKYPQDHYFPDEFFQVCLWTLLGADIHGTLSLSSKSKPLLPLVDGTRLAVVTVPILVCGFKPCLVWTYFGVLQIHMTFWFSVQRYSLEQIHSHIYVMVPRAHEHACSAL